MNSEKQKQVNKHYFRKKFASIPKPLSTAPQQQQTATQQNNNTNTPTYIYPYKKYYHNPNANANAKGNGNGVDESIIKQLRNSINSQIDQRARYYVDSRLGILINGTELMTRGVNAFNINTATNMFEFKNNGNVVASFDYAGVLRCKNIWLNGISMLAFINQMYDITNNGASIYVKHTDLKSGTYDMDIDTATMKHLNVTADDKNTLEFIPQYNSAMLISTNRSTGIQLFNPNIVAAGNFTALAFGTANNQDEYGVLRYYNNATAANRYIGIGMNTSTNCLSIYQDKRVVINTANNIEQCLLCKYNGNLANNKYLRIGCGDNRDTGIFAYGRNSNTNYLYLKLQGRSAEIDIYANYTLFHGQNYIAINNTKTSGGIMYMRMGSITNNGQASLYIGKDESTNGEIGIGYIHSTTNPLGYLGFYGNEELITWDKNGNMNIPSITCTGSISCNGLYSSDNATIDGSVLCTQLDVANYTKNDWYAKFRVEDYLGNGDYVRLILKDLGGQGNIDLFHDTQYYGIRLQVPTANVDDNKLCIYPTGVTIDGDLDCYDDVTIWENLEVAKDISITNNSYKLKCNNIKAYSGSTVTVDSNIYIDNTNQLQTDILNCAFDTYIQCKCSMEVSNEDNDAVLASDNVVVYDKLQVDAVDINSVATSSDVNDNTKVNDNTIATTAYIDEKIPTIDANVEHAYNHSHAVEEGCAITLDNGPNIGANLKMASGFVPSTGIYVFIGENRSDMYISYDGFRWWIGYSGLSGLDWKQMIWDGEKLVMIAANDDRLAYSYSGETYSWQETSAVLTSNSGWCGIAYSRTLKRYVCCNNGGDSVLYGNDFNTQWTEVHTGINGNCRAIVYGEGIGFVVVGGHDSAFSTDGITWNINTIDNAQSFTNIGYGSRGFIATDINGHIYKSTNGTTWSLAYSLGAGVSCYNISYGTGWYCTTWQFNHAYVTKDLVNWEHYDIGYDEPAGLAYGNGLFIMGQANYNDYRGAVIPVSGCYLSYRLMMERIYPPGSIYISMNSTNPKYVLGFGTWTQIVDRFLYCRNTSQTTGGNATHNHNLDRSHAYAKLSLHGNGSIKYDDLTVGSSWNSNYRINSGGSGAYESYNDPYGCGLGGRTEDASTLPPYITCYAWYRS